MRPEVLTPLFADVSVLPGIGPRLAALITKTAGPRVVDLLATAPTGVIDRRLSETIEAATPGTTVTLKVRIDRRERPE
ncbi:MAG: ATP-dependent DNA helicase RecG, partial [Pseudomonadota bacterium]